MNIGMSITCSSLKSGLKFFPILQQLLCNKRGVVLVLQAAGCNRETVTDWTLEHTYSSWATTGSIYSLCYFRAKDSI